MAQTYQNPRLLAHQILVRVETRGSYADILLEEKLPSVEKPYRALVTELVYGVLRWQIKIDWIINQLSKIPTHKLEARVLCALRLGIYQLYFLRGIPPHACISESVELVKPLGRERAGFVNAVLRSAQREKENVSFPSIKEEPVRYVSVIFSHPQWLVERWLKRYGLKETIELCRVNLTPPPTILRVNTLVTTRDALMEELKKEGIRARPTRFSPVGLEIVERHRGRLKPADRRYYIQDEASQLIPLLVSPSPGECILDVCSAPGGKATHIAQLMENRGLVVAMDSHPTRLKKIEGLARRFRIEIIKPLLADARTFTPQYSLTGMEEGSLPSGGFDAILVDAPCTGLGTIRRTPDIKLRRTPEDIKSSANTQREILSNISGLLKKGGRLVYSVCTLEPEETEDVVRWFLKEKRGFCLESIAQILPHECRRFITPEGFFRTLPHRDGLDGFFAVRLKRTD